LCGLVLCTAQPAAPSAKAPVAKAKGSGPTATKSLSPSPPRLKKPPPPPPSVEQLAFIKNKAALLDGCCAKSLFVKMQHCKEHSFLKAMNAANTLEQKKTLKREVSTASRPGLSLPEYSVPNAYLHHPC
jgi:hypothetical protein